MRLGFRIVLGVLGGGFALSVVALATAPAAHARVVVGVGLGFPTPLYYSPPPVVYAPPPVIYAPPPPVAYVPAPAAQPQCREYQTQTMIDGRPQPSHGTACLQPDGTWRLVN